MAIEKSAQWTEPQRHFMDWLLVPADSRTPKTIAEYARQNQLSPVALYQWKALPGFMTEVRRVLYNEIGDALPDVLREIVRRARIGEVQFVDRYLSLVGGSDIVAGANARRIDNTMSDDDAARILSRAIPALSGGHAARATIIEQGEPASVTAIIAQGTEPDMTIVMDETN
jgi:hypothetical protein